MMKLSQLKAHVDRAIEHVYHGRGDLDVVVRTATGGIPHAKMVPIESALPGFDWTAGFFVLQPAEPVVVVRGFLGDIRELGRTRLAALKQDYKGIRYEKWLDGFVEGVRAHVTACADDEALLAHRQQALLDVRKLLVDKKLAKADVLRIIENEMVENDQKLEGK